MANKNEWTADRTIYLDKDGQVAEQKRDAVTKLVSAGLSIPMDRARELGLVKDEEPEQEQPVAEVKAEDAPAETKAIDAPPENKSAKAHKPAKAHGHK